MRVNTRNSFAYYCVYPVVTSYNLSTKKRLIGQKVCVDRSIPQWGDAPVWNELHMSTDFPTYWD